VAPTASTSDAQPFFPFIDTFGQYMHKDWPGKVHSLEDLQQHLASERAEYQKNPGPDDWCTYGGWKGGPQLKATGFFRTEKYQGKWWLVDPNGHLFFSQGIDCVRMLDSTPMDDRAGWFADSPSVDPAWKSFQGQHGYALKGHYAGKSPAVFSFAACNLARKYGSDWTKAANEMAHQRLRSWGLNTIGLWSDGATTQLRKTAYVTGMGTGNARMIEGSEGYWSKFPDPFDPEFRKHVMQSMAHHKGNSAGDPWCLGYFSDNEMSWGDEVSLSIASLKSPADQSAKKAFIADLQAKYVTIEKLNDAWGTKHLSWEALSTCREAPERKKAEADLLAFYSRVAGEYFRVVSEVIHEVAPHQLYLGCRFAWVNSRATAEAARYCDVVSFNLYQNEVADFHGNGPADVPMIIGEFHFGALDRGMFHTGLVPVADQNARARAYENYVRGALRHPNFVGCHWFQYQDEPLTGRVYDEENYQIGFVDGVDTPYAETVEAARRISRDLYRYRLDH
jgi:hypothetical protein